MRRPEVRIELPFDVGSWMVDARKNTIERRNGSVKRRLEPKAMRVLVLLASRAGEDVSRGEILREVRGIDRTDDGVLTNAIWELRRAFDDDRREPELIQTVPRRGYRLVAEVRGQGSRSAGDRKGVTLPSASGQPPTGNDRPFLEGQRAALLRVLTSRFGPLPDDIVEYVYALAGLDAIEELLDRAPHVTSLDELELE